MSNRGVRKGLSLLMTMLLCVTSFNFSLIAQAGDAGAARIIGFNPLDESIATQSLPVGASIDDVVFPDSIRATVETVGEVEVQKAVERAAEEEPIQEEKAEESVQTDESEPVADEVSNPVGEMINEPTEGEASETEESQELTDETPAEEVEEPIDTGLIDILFPAIIANAEELDESELSPIAGAVEVGTPTIEPKTEYETVIETRTFQSEITIENVKWEIADGAKFDSTKAATYTFAPVFTTDYVVAAAVPTIKVNIVNADSKISFDKSVVIDGVRISVKADEGVFPDGATLSVEKVYGSDLQAVEEAVDEERAADKNKVESYTFDIKILDKDGNEIEPDNSKGQVKVSFTLEEVADVNLETDVYHVKGEVGDLSVDKLDATETAATTVEAVTDGFSFYTVEFTYNNLQYVMQGDTTVALADILSAVGLQGTVTNAVSDAPELFSVANTESGWMVTANQAFTTEQKLTITIGDKNYVILVTDDLAPVSYLAWDESQKTLVEMTGDKACKDYTSVTSSSELQNWTDGKWYVVNNDATISDMIVVGGIVNLILVDGKTLTAEKAIIVRDGATLNIYAQSKGDGAGKLIVNGYAASAGIGGDLSHGCGIVTINGGIIEATGVVGAAGIGGGFDGAGGTVTINGGTVTATGGERGAGIGGGFAGAGGTVTINGGTVTAKGGNGGAGIGGGNIGAGGTVTIATGLIVSAGIDEASAGPVEISQFIENHNQTWVHIEPPKDPVSYLTWDDDQKKLVEMTGDKACASYQVVKSSSEPQQWSSGWYVVTGNVTSKKITLEEGADIHLILCDGATLTLDDSNGGILGYGAHTNLTIYAQSTGDRMGKIIITAQDNSAIYVVGNITINGGDIAVTSGAMDGIRSTSGERSNSGDVIINGGIVKTVGQSTGIFGNNVKINSGTVEAHGDCAIDTGEGNTTFAGGTSTLNGNHDGINGRLVTIKNGATVEITGSVRTNIINEIAGTGWTDIAGTEGKSTIPVSATGVRYSYKRFVFDTSIPFSSLNKYDVIQAGLMLKNDTGEEQQVFIKHKSLGEPISKTVVADDTCSVPFTMIAAQVKDASGKYNICGTDEIVFESSEYTVGVGETKNDISLKFAGYDITAANENFTFKSDNEDIATVNSDGAVTGNAAGTTKITATLFSDPSFVATCTLNVGAEATQKTDADVIAPPEGETTWVDTDTKPEVSDEFSEEAKKIADETGDDIELKLVVAPQGQSKATESEFLKNDEEMHDKVKSQFKDEESVEVDVLDINIKKITNNSESLLSETSEVLGICIGYNFSGKFDPVVVRKHGSSSNPFRALSSVPTGKYQDGTFFADTKNHKLYIYSRLFSEYVIAYSTVEGNAQNRTVATTSTSETPTSYPKTVSVYRLFNTKTGDHLFTANIEERTLLLQQHAAEGWTDEGIAFETAIKSDIPVYRLFDAKNGIHFYTSNIATRDTYIANGCTDEGIAWYAPSNTGRKVYKLSDAKSGKPLYTISKAETDALANAGLACEDADFVVF